MILEAFCCCFNGSFLCCEHIWISNSWAVVVEQVSLILVDNLISKTGNYLSNDTSNKAECIGIEVKQEDTEKTEALLNKISGVYYMISIKNSNDL